MGVIGQYQLDVSFPKVVEVQRITFKILSKSMLSEESTFSLKWKNFDGVISTSDIAYNASETEMKDKIEELNGISSVVIDAVTTNALELVWDVTFISIEGDIETLTAIYA